MNKKTNDKTIRRNWKALPLGALIGKSTKKAMQKRGFTEQRMLTEWSSVVGERIATFSTPEKMAYSQSQNAGATLHLRCDPSIAPEIPYLEPIILEKIATFFGFKAVARLVIHQAPVHRSTEKTTVASKDTPILSAQEAGLESVEDEALKEALQRLATARHHDS